IETGLIQREIEESAYRAQLAGDRAEAVTVGVNKFAESEMTYDPAVSRPTDGKRVAPLFTVDVEVERRQIERVRAVRASRSADAWRAALAAVSHAARNGANLVPPIVAAVEAKATIGEISDAMRAVFGEFEQGAALGWRWS